MSDYLDDYLKPTKRFTRVHHAYLVNKRISCQAKVLFLLLLELYQFNKNGIHPSQSYLAECMNLKNRRSVHNYMKELRSEYLIEWEQVIKKSGTANHYYLDQDNMRRIKNKRKAVAKSLEKKAVVVQLQIVKDKMNG